jgi:hypothetical protein
METEPEPRPQPVYGENRDSAMELGLNPDHAPTAAADTHKKRRLPEGSGVFYIHNIERGDFLVLGRPGSDLLSQGLSHSTIGAEEFNGRVRDGIGFMLLARTTRPAKDKENTKQAIFWRLAPLIS